MLLYFNCVLFFSNLERIIFKYINFVLKRYYYVFYVWVGLCLKMSVLEVKRFESILIGSSFGFFVCIGKF